MVDRRQRALTGDRRHEGTRSAGELVPLRCVERPGCSISSLGRGSSRETRIRGNRGGAPERLVEGSHALTPTVSRAAHFRSSLTYGAAELESARARRPSRAAEASCEVRARASRSVGDDGTLVDDERRVQGNRVHDCSEV